ncbi:MAG TPA: glycosyltransferase [Acidimicrobiales bacterium]|jgi:hypothetical protein|nr:glycosyltransferase [Acidimicrobiales bacterium]
MLATQGNQNIRRPIGRATAKTVDIVVPVYNEAHVLERSVRRLRSYLDGEFPYPATVVIADNGSTDDTWLVASALADDLPGVKAVRIDGKGRGRALKTLWSASTAGVLAYMDVDLSTDLAALLPLVAPLISGHSDLAIGSRLAHGAQVGRGLRREGISRAYNSLIHLAAGRSFSDAQCGFKAITADAARHLLPTVVDGEWFFDTELLLAASSSGMRIHEVPVDWTDDPDSRVHVASTAWADIKGLARVSGHRAVRRLGVAVLVAALAATWFLGLMGLVAPLPAAALAFGATLALIRVGALVVDARRRSRALAESRPTAPVELRLVKPAQPVGVA